MIGYDSWNDYVLEERMAKTPQKVQSFLDQFEAKLKPKSQIELQELKKLKADETSNSEAEIKIWDYAYYSARNKKFKFQVDIQSLKEFFPLETVLQGMFGLVQKLFGLDFEEQKSGNFYRWSDEVRKNAIACAWDTLSRLAARTHIPTAKMVEIRRINAVVC